MHIANPIYDVVFKFMMEDSRVAKAFLSAIIQEKVTELDFDTTESTVRIPSKTERETETGKKPEGPGLNLTVCRFDFSARISLPGGRYKTVVIELQKAKLASDIMRFRRYLGLHYQNPGNSYGEGNGRKARQIYCIFLLGYAIGIPGAPVIRVNSSVEDVATDKPLQGTNEFIRSLHHRSWIVQIEQLKDHRRTDLEKLLSIFDQENRTKNHHILNVDEDGFPEEYRSIIRRLRMAAESEEIQMEMEMEDDYVEELRDRERKIAEKEKIIEEKVRVIEEKDKALQEQGKALEEQDRALEEKDRLIEELRKQLSGGRK